MRKERRRGEDKAWHALHSIVYAPQTVGTCQTAPSKGCEREVGVRRREVKVRRKEGGERVKHYIPLCSIF